MGAGHVRLRPSLVDDHEALGIEIELAVEPGLPALQDVGPLLLAGVRGLFLRGDPVPAEEALERAVAEGLAALGQRGVRRLDSDVRGRLQQRLDQPALRLALDRGWARRTDADWALSVTPEGRRAFRAELGVAGW